MKISFPQNQQQAILQVLKICGLLVAMIFMFIVGRDSGKDDALSFLTDSERAEISQKQQQREAELLRRFEQLYKAEGERK